MPVWTATERMPLRWAAMISLGASPTSAMGVWRAIQPCARAWRMARRASPARSLAIWPKAPKRKYGFRPAVELLPSDAREVAGDQSEQHAMFLQTAQEGAHAGAGFALEVGNAAHVDMLRRADDLRHGRGKGGGGRADVAQHAGGDVGVEHAVDGDAIGAVSRPGTRRAASTRAWRGGGPG